MGLKQRWGSNEQEHGGSRGSDRAFLRSKPGRRKSRQPSRLYCFDACCKFTCKRGRRGWLQTHGKFLIANNVSDGNGINGVVGHYTDRVIVRNNIIANNGTVPLSTNRQRTSGSVVNYSQDIEILNNRVQVNVAGDAAIRFFG